MVLFVQHTCTFSGADLELQDTGVLAAAEYGWLAVWEHSPLVSWLGAASIAAGRSAGGPSRPLTPFRFLFWLFFVTRILHLYSALIFT